MSRAQARAQVDEVLADLERRERFAHLTPRERAFAEAREREARLREHWGDDPASQARWERGRR